MYNPLWKSYIYLYPMKRPALSLAFILAAALTASAAPPELKMGLREAEARTLQNSPELKSAESERAAAHERTRNQFTLLWPKLSLDASYKYISEVPSFKPLPTGPSIALGDNKNTSYGPTASWLLWDSGNLYHNWKSQTAIEKAKNENVLKIKRQLLFQTRMAYFQVQLALEQVKSLIESLKLSDAQYNDIKIQQRAGARSRMDVLSAHQDVLTRRLELRQARADLAAALRELLYLTGTDIPPDASAPVDKKDEQGMPAETEAPTLLLALDPLKDSETYLASAAEGSPNENHPLPQSLLEMAQAADELSKSLNSDYGPSLQVSGRISRDYPNGPILETITQKTVGVNATWPLFQWGKTRYAVKEQKNRAETTRFEREQVLLNLKRDWDKAQDQLKGRRAQEEINKQSVLETKELAKLTYSSYVAGRSSYLEVQTANLRALETNIRTARTNVQILIQLAILDSIGKGNLP